MTERIPYPGPTPSSKDRSHHFVTAAIYALLALTGLVGTWWFNIQWFANPIPGFASGITGYLGAWFANAASSSAAVDLLVMTAAAAVLYWKERWIFGRHTWLLALFIPLSLLVAVSFTFPLFLALRHLALTRTPAPGKPQP